MDEAKRKELYNAYKKEKDHRAVTRMLAVYMAYVRKKSIDETAIDLMRSLAGCVNGWIVLMPEA